MQYKETYITSFLITSTTIILVLAMLVFTLLYYFLKKQLYYKHSYIELQLNYEKTIVSAQMEIQENTLQHISRDIHDNISLTLTLAKLHLNTINWSQIEKANSQVNSSIELLSETIFKLNGISKSLSSDIASNFGLIGAIENEIKRINDACSFPIQFDLIGEPVALINQKEVVLFRIVQEAFNNIIKHAKASEVSISLNYFTEHLYIMISDNGVGFDCTSEENAFNKAGLKNMKGRAKMLHGEMEIITSPGQGTNLKFKIPF